MAKFSIYQITKKNRDLASQSVFYGISEAFTQADARKAFANGYYSKNADVEAADNIEVQKLINQDRTNTRILKTGILRNISVGDLINNTDTNQWFIVGPKTFDIIKIKQK